MSEHRYDIRISESCVDPNPLIIERQDPDNFTRFQTRERCALEIAAYVFNSDNRQVLKIHLSVIASVNGTTSSTKMHRYGIPEPI